MTQFTGLAHVVKTLAAAMVDGFFEIKKKKTQDVANVAKHLTPSNINCILEVSHYEQFHCS